MRPINQVLGNSRVTPLGRANGFDALELRSREGALLCLYGADEDGMEHVSVSPRGTKRESERPCPTWRQMHEVKRLFWRDDELVVQLHPPEADYLHGPTFDTNVLHLWRPCDGDYSVLNDWKGGW